MTVSSGKKSFAVLLPDHRHLSRTLPAQSARPSTWLPTRTASWRPARSGSSQLPRLSSAFWAFWVIWSQFPFTLPEVKNFRQFFTVFLWRSSSRTPASSSSTWSPSSGGSLSGKYLNKLRLVHTSRRLQQLLQYIATVAEIENFLSPCKNETVCRRVAADSQCSVNQPLLGPWWWCSSCQHTDLPLGWFEFESH